MKIDINEEKDYIISLRRYFHQNPELSLQEFHTAEKIEEELEAMGIQYSRVGETGVVGIIEHVTDSKSSKRVALRADMDALPIQEKNETAYRSRVDGVMHACGHDGHTAALLGAAKILKQHENEINGTIILIFQQGEEMGAGAKQFIQAGYLKQVDRILGIHMASALPVGKIAVKAGESNASCDYFKITVVGKSAHVSKPHEGIDALYIASQIVVSIQSIIARSLDPLESGVVGIGKLQAGTNYNIIAKEAILEGTTRAFNTETRTLIHTKVITIAENTAKMYGATAKVEFVDYASPLINDPVVAAEVAEVAGACVGKDNVLTEGTKNMMADDFAEYLLETKGQYAFVGSASSESTSFPHHHERFDLDEKAVLIAAELYVAYAEKVLEKNEVRMCL